MTVKAVQFVNAQPEPSFRFLSVAELQALPAPNWLVVDLLVDPNSKRGPELPDFTIQLCDPTRPMTVVYVGGNRHRWEIMLMPGDDPGGIIVTILLGIAGSLVAGFLGRLAGWYLPGEPAGFIASIVGAVILLGLYRLLIGRGTSGRGGFRRAA